MAHPAGHASGGSSLASVLRHAGAAGAKLSLAVRLGPLPDTLDAARRHLGRKAGLVLVVLVVGVVGVARGLELGPAEGRFLSPGTTPSTTTMGLSPANEAPTSELAREPSGAAGGWPPPTPAAIGLDPLDLGAKLALVGTLLFLALRLLRRFVEPATLRGGPIVVLASRPLGPKTTLHLVAIGERRLLVGESPAGLVGLTELDSDELAMEAPRVDELTGGARPRSVDLAAVRSAKEAVR